MIRTLAIIPALFASCTEPKPGVVVARNGNGYVISLRDCRLGMTLGIANLSVHKTQSSANAAELQCELTASDGDVFFERWEYGTELRGFKMTPCAPLERAATYQIDLESRPRPVRGHFVVQADGEVTMLNGDCKN